MSGRDETLESLKLSRKLGINSHRTNFALKIIEELQADLEFAYKRSKVLADMLVIPIHESPEVTGTILGLVRGAVERLIAERDLFKEETVALTTKHPHQYCCWSQNTHDDVDCSRWNTTCDNAFYFTEDGPTDNGMNFCCYCGKPLISSGYVDTEQSEI